ncbi:hypothetical protein JCM10449v2_002321 [Rhodotorula kratochvilovae]
MSDEPLSLELAALIASLHLADLAELNTSRKGKGRAGEQTDEERAFALYAEELEQVEQLDADRRFALSFEAAGHADGPALDALAAQEDEAARDRELALAVSRGRTFAQARSACSSRPTSRAGSSFGSRSTSLTRPSTASPPPYTTAAPAASSSSSASAAPRVACIICTERVPFSSAVRVPCASSHPYCGSCLADLFRAATRDESLFPPRCDGAHIPLALARAHLSAEEVRAFEARAEEFGTPNRVYCASARCSAFLGAASDAKSAVSCGSCSAQTCTACKAPWHGPFGLCGASGDDEAAALLESERGFRRCPGCRRVVELDTGCYHMTCLCSTQFCYLCAAPWKTCACAQWDETRLVRAAEARVQAEAPRAAAPAPAQVERMVEQLRTNHECAHRSWGIRHGSGQCQSCYFRLDRYLLRCRECAMLACVRCRRNRL